MLLQERSEHDGPREGLAPGRVDMHDPRAESSGQLAIDMAQLLVDHGIALADFDKAAVHGQRPAGQDFTHEADVLVHRQDSRHGILAERVRHPETMGKNGEALDLLLDIDAHIHVPHLVAIPLIAATPPECDHAAQSRQMPRTSTTARVIRKPAASVSACRARLVSSACSSSAPWQLSQIRNTAEWLWRAWPQAT